MFRLILFLFLSLLSLLPSSAQNSSCPLDFAILQTLVREKDVNSSNNVAANCGYIAEGLRLVLSQYLRTTGSFYPPLSSSESCWDSYDSVVDSFLPNFKVRASCGFKTQWISEGCLNISTQSEFEKLVPQSALNDAVSNCNQSLANGSPCASCLTSLTTLQASYLKSKDPFNGNISDCTNLPLIYAGAVINQFGPSDPGTAKCLFSLDFSSSKNGSNWKKKLLISLIVVVGFIGLCSVFGGVYMYLRLKKRREKIAAKNRWITRVGSGTGLNLSSIGGSTHLMKFGFDEIKRATKNFHRDNLIGRGGYGNVYKGLLPDGTEIAVKRFKNCSAAGDASFTHEVEVIASIRHVNLVELRGYCVATTNLEGHQRLIVCDLMHNGSLHDHLYGNALERKLSWPVRQRIALGMARGLAYLHYGAQPSIIHRDIKASNILLDDNFEAKVADFGLAKFNPEGFSHLSTRVAGTMGYVAPEYALYGQLTERSDVFSFGVVLLELLSGKKAILSVPDGQGQPSLVTDWAWSLVRKGHALDVIEEGMPELGPDSVMEKYVLTAVLCSHPQLYARPTMDQVVKILETDMQVPSIPERPISFNAELEDIERSASSSGSGQLSTSGGFQSYSMGHIDFASHNGQEEAVDPATSLR
ncbi:probable LRR receptor-like serine/threonine-protein kinase RKF3 [Chenopodium quinoa]|uniref:probable LRR receptor-like serine/threonine-protein kinase RKF3 n=1 Tax=Chenopodium quinoa TaxID=63459 RepID=UPI000B793482|nr:probable LRR receptor-like serine/threonine-protein kinase RKF3 [Chenopodium quinoa]